MQHWVLCWLTVYQAREANCQIPGRLATKSLCTFTCVQRNRKSPSHPPSTAAPSPSPLQSISWIKPSPSQQQHLQSFSNTKGDPKPLHISKYEIQTDPARQFLETAFNVLDGLPGPIGALHNYSNQDTVISSWTELQKVWRIAHTQLWAWNIWTKTRAKICTK